MDKIKIDAKLLHETEISLNRLKYHGLEIGNILSYYFDRLYCKDFDKRFFWNLIVLLYYFVKPVDRKRLLSNYQKKMVYFRTGQHRHLKSMQEAITDNRLLQNETLVIGSKNEQEIDGSVFYSSSLMDLAKIISFLASNKKMIVSSLKPLHLPIKIKVIVFIDLILQLLKASSLKKFITLQKSTVLIGADYDRGCDASLFFAVAKSLHIKSFTFQHGVLNPPVGYSPVNADEIWVWGDMARMQLQQLGVPAHKIRVTGTPIVENIEISDNIKERVLERYNLKKGSTVVLALSSPDKANDQKLVRFFAEIKEKYAGPNDNYVVKIHPARNYASYNWITNDFHIDILPHDIPYQDFLNIVDILLAHTSGIATEVLYYGKKVGIMDILDISAGNGMELNKYFHVPLLKKTSDFDKLLNENTIIDSRLAFYKIGEEAKREIQQIIYQYI